MSNELAKLDVPQLMQLGSVFAKSGFFADARQEAQAVVKILAGAEMGFSPIASMMGVYVIQGRVSVGANLMAAAVKKSGKYDYRVLQMDETACEIEYYQGGQSIGKSKFTIADAKKAQTKNLDKYARNMLFARAMSNGVRWYCPDALGGTPVYTPEEMGADTDEEGNVIGGVVEVAPMPSLPAPDPQPAAATYPCVTCQQPVKAEAAAIVEQHAGVVLCEKHWTEFKRIRQQEKAAAAEPAPAGG